MLEAESALPGTRRLAAIGVRVDVGGGPAALLVTVAPWLRAEDLPTFRLFGGQIGAALDAALAVDTLASRDAELAALNRVAEAASLSPDLGALLGRASAEARGLVGCDEVAFYLVDAERREARLLHLDGADATARRDLARVPLSDLGLEERAGGGPTSRVLQLEELDGVPRERLRRLGLATAVLVPLRFRSALLGTMVAGFRSHRPAPACRLDLLQAMAAHLAGALDTHRLMGDLRGRVAELTLLNDLASATAAVAPDRLVERALQRVATTFRTEAAAAHVLEGDELVLVASLGVSAETARRMARLPRDAGALGTAVAERRTIHLTGREEASPAMAWVWQQEGLAVTAVVPLLVRGGVLGVFSLGRRRPEPFGPAHLSLLSAIGAQLGVILENARLYGEAQRRVAELSAASAGLARAQDQLVRKERLAAIGELAAVVAHEVRNPLGVLFNSLATLRRMVKPSGDALLLFEMAAEEATRLNRIVGDLLDFARPSPLALRPEPLDRVVDGAVAAALGAAGGRVALVREVPDDLPEVPMDARLVRQAVLNVAMNAVQAMPQGGTLTVRLRAGEGVATVALADTGPGVPAELTGRIFEPFFTTRPTGTGLGLAVVKRILDDHRGAVEVAPAEGGGTCFTLRLPLAPGTGRTGGRVERAPARGEDAAMSEPVIRAVAPGDEARPDGAVAAKVLVVDDQRNMRASTAIVLREAGYEVAEAEDGAAAMRRVAQDSFDVVLTDVRMGAVDGMDVLRSTLEASPSTQVIVMTAYGTIEAAVEAMRRGAYDYIAKPFQEGELLLRVAKAAEKRRLLGEMSLLRREFQERYGLEHIVGRSAPMRELLERVVRVAPTDATVLVTGESGTGKELIARALHTASRRSERPFVPVNCAAITETLLESELFGHARGSFTGATRARRGLFEEASGGTLFIDEVGETAPGFQAKLLRALQEGEIRRVGESLPVKVDVRVIAATNQNLRAAVAERRFREDLFYRLNVVPLRVPALRERPEDVPPLAHHFLESYAQRTGERKELAPDALQKLVAHPWPGNVRELENMIEQAAALTPRATLTAADFRFDVALPPVTGAAGAPLRTLAEAVDEAERAAIEAALARAAGELGRVARELGVSSTTLWRKMKRLGLGERG